VAELSSGSSLSSFSSLGSTENKKSLLDKAAEKQSRLISFNPNQFIDGDTLRYQTDPSAEYDPANPNYRLDPLREGMTVNAFETQHEQAINPKTFSVQAARLSKLTGKPKNDVTLLDIFAQGDLGTSTALAAALKGQSFTSPEGPVQPQLEVISKGEVGAHGRTIADFRNPVTGKTLSEVMNTPELNASYGSRFNNVQQLIDKPSTEDYGISVADSLSDGVVSGVKVATGILNSITGMIGTGADALNTALDILPPETVDKMPSRYKAQYQVLQSVFGEVAKGATTFSDQVHKGNQALEKEFFSEDMLKQKENWAVGRKAINAQSEKDDLKGDNPLWSEAVNLVEKTSRELSETLPLIADNPKAAVDASIESLGSMYLIIRAALGGGTKAVLKELKGKNVDEAAKFHASKAKNIISQAGSKKAAIVAIAIVEGSANGQQIASEIRGTTADVLYSTSPRMQEAVDSGEYTPEEAREKLAREGNTYVSALSGIVAAGISMFTGAAGVEARLFNPNSKIAKTFFGTALLNAGKSSAVAGGKEFVEEAAQSASGSLIGNAATRILADENQSITEGTVFDTAVGAVAGLGTGVVLTGASQLGNVAKGAVTDTVQVATKVADAVTKDKVSAPVVNAVKAANESGDYSKVHDITEVTRVATVKALLDNTPSPVASEEVKEAHLAAIQEHAQAMVDHALTHRKTEEDFDNLTAEEGKAYQDNLDEVKALRALTNSLVDVNDESKAEAIEALYKKSETSKLEAKEVEKVLGSMLRKGTQTQLETVLANTEGLSEAQTTQLQGKIRTLKDSEGVSDSVRDGNVTDRDIGYSEYQQSVESHIASGNTKALRTTLAKFKAFVDHQTGKTAFFREAQRIGNNNGNVTPESIAAANEFMAASTTYRTTTSEAYNVDSVGGTVTLGNLAQRDAEALTAAYAESYNNANLASPTASQEVSATPESEVVVENTAPIDESLTLQPGAKFKAYTDSITDVDRIERAIAKYSGAKASDLDKVKAKYLRQHLAKLQGPSPSVDEINAQLAEAANETEESNDTSLNSETVQPTNSSNEEVLGQEKEVTTETVVESEITEETPNSTEATVTTPVEETVTEETPDNTVFSNFFNVTTKVHDKVTKMFGKLGEFSFESFFKINPMNTPIHSMMNIFDKNAQIASLTDKEDVQRRRLIPVFESFKAASKKLMGNFNFKEDKEGNRTAQEVNADAIAKDPSLLLVTGGGQLPDAVLAAMFTVVGNWIGTMGRSSVTNTEADIRALLGKEKGSYISDYANDLYGKVGIPKNSLAEDLGKQITKALGIRVLSNDIDGTALGNLQLALGLRAIDALVLSKVLVESKVTPKERNTALKTSFDETQVEEISEEEKKLPTAFIALGSKQSLDEESNQMLISTNEYGKSMREVIVAAPELFSKLNSETKESSVGYTWKPITKAASIMKRTFQKVPKAAQEALRKYQSRAYYRKDDNVNVFMSLTKMQQLEILGYVEDVKQTLYHTRWKAQENENDAIVKALEDFIEYNNAVDALGLDEDAAIYFKHEMWKNSRIGIVGSNMNPQSNKLARFLIGMEEWNTTITTEEHRILFAEAIAEATGIQESAIAEMHKPGISTDPKLRAMHDAVQAIIRQQDGFSIDGDLDTIQAGIDAGGQKLHTLDALVAMSFYHPTKTFETQLVSESDGKTNGVLISANQFGGDGTAQGMAEQLARGNIFTTLAESAALDTYKTVFSKYLEFLNTAREEAKDKAKFGEVSDAINSLIGDVGTLGSITALGRNLAKPSTITTIYGASLEKLKTNFGLDILQRIEDDISTHRDNEEELLNIQKAVNTITGNTTSWLVNDKPVLTNKMHPKMVQNLVNIISNVNGQAMADAIEDNFGYIMESGTQITEAAQIIFEVFTEVLAVNVEEATRKKGSNLSKAEIESLAENLQHLMPIFATAGSNGMREGINTLKVKMVRQYDEEHEVQISYETKTEKPISTTAGGEIANSSSGHSSSTVYDSPGKGSVVNQVHALDAAPILLTVAEHAVLAVHDAIIGGIGNIREATVAMNSNLDSVMDTHRIRTSVVETLARVTGNKDPKVVAAINAVNKRRAASFIPKQPISEFESEFSARTDRDNKLIDEVNAEVTSSYQYGTEISALNKLKPVNTNPTDAQNEKEGEKVVAEVVTAAEQGQSLGSQQEGLDPNSYESDNNFKVNSESITQIFENLLLVGTENNLDTPEQTATLKGILNNLVGKVLHKINSEVDLSFNTTSGVTQGAATRSKVVIDITTGLPLDTSAMSPQEVYVHELVHIVTQYAVDNDFLLRDTLRHLRDSVEDHITVEDFLTFDAEGNVVTEPGNTEAQERAAAQLRMDYIFGNAENQGKTTKRRSLITKKIVEDHVNDGLHEFLAFGLTNAKFRSILASAKVVNGANKKEKIWDKNPLVTLGNVLNKVLAFVRGKITGINGLRPDQQLTALATRIAGLHERKRMMLFGSFDVNSKVFEPTVAAMRKFITRPLHNLSKTAIVKSSRFKKVRQVGAIVENLEHVSLDTFMKVSRDVAKNIGISEKNLGIQFIREMIGKTADSRYLHHLQSAVKQGIDQAREDTTSKLQKVLTDKYNRPLTSDEKAQITKVLIKPDVQVLFNEDFSNIDEVLELLEDPSKLNERLSTLTAELKSMYGKNGIFYAKHAASLGNFKAKGKHNQDESFLNAYLIANLSGIPPNVSTPSGDLSVAEQMIDELSTLHALAVTDSVSIQKVVSIFKDEIAKKEGDNGVVYTLQVHRGLVKDSEANLFNGNKAHMIAGYTKELLNPNIVFKVDNEVDGKIWERQGYVKQKVALSKDPKDKNNRVELYLYILKDGRLATRVSSVASMINNTSKGVGTVRSREQAGNENAYVQGITDRNQIHAGLAAVVASQFTPKDTTVGSKDAVLVPIRDDTGRIADYRYMMTENDKDSVLEKNNSFDEILGGMSADIVVKPKAVELNRRTVKEVHEAYKKEFVKDPRGYVAISPISLDPEIREIYRLLPDDMKKEIKKVWGNQPMQVKAKHVRLIFGFRKFSVTSLDKMWSDKDKTNATVLQEMGMYMAEKLNTSKVRTAENVWQDFIGYVKDVIVIKGLIVMKENIASNNVLLYMMGLSLGEITTYQAEGIHGVREYMKTHRELFELETDLKVNTSMTKARRKSTERKVSRLKADITANPVTPLIDAGVFQTIMEDVDTNETQFSYKGIIQEKTKKLTDRIPQPIIDLSKQVVMSHDTGTYKALKNTTQMSDFVARYALHKYNMSASNPKRMTEAESMDAIEEVFINYDLPTGTALQYANDMGLIMFTKFWMRIQKVYLKVLLESPGRALSILVGNEFLFDLTSIADSSLVFGNTPQLQNLLRHLSTASDTPGLAALLKAFELAAE
jgi:hypothetical protein